MKRDPRQLIVVDAIESEDFVKRRIEGLAQDSSLHLSQNIVLFIMSRIKFDRVLTQRFHSASNSIVISRVNFRGVITPV